MTPAAPVSLPVRLRPKAAMRSAFIACAIFVLSACDNVQLFPGRDDAPTKPSGVAAGPVGNALCRLGYSAVPMRRLSSGHHKIEATLNSVPATFLVDTGANVTTIRADLAERHGIGSGGLPAAVAGLGGMTGGRMVRIDQFAIGEIPIRQSRILIADLSMLDQMTRMQANVRVDGIIGQDVLQEHRAIIDVASHQMFLLPTGRPGPIEQPELCDEASAPSEATARTTNVGSFALPLQPQLNLKAV